MSTATEGRRREHKVRDHMIAAGWQFIMRAAGSKGPGDLLMAHPWHGAALIQVGTPSKSLGPTERHRFVNAGTLCGALTILATYHPGGEIIYTEVTVDLPKTWAKWTP